MLKRVLMMTYIEFPLNVNDVVLLDIHRLKFNELIFFFMSRLDFYNADGKFKICAEEKFQIQTLTSYVRSTITSQTI